jgi:putative flippase GtrA
MSIKRQAATYVFVGLVSAMIDVVTMWIFFKIGAPLVIATSLGYSVGLVVNFVGHRQVTFSAPYTHMTVVRFVALIIGNYLLTLVIVEGAERTYDAALLGKVASLPIVALNGFLLGRFWIFRNAR